jgi:hypothetical protein
MVLLRLHGRGAYEPEVFGAFVDVSERLDDLQRADVRASDLLVGLVPVVGA